MADALRADDQGVEELLGRHRAVALDVLEPFDGIARRVLDLENLDRAVSLIGGQGLVEIDSSHGAGRGERAAQADPALRLNGIFQCQLGAAADREMRGVCGVAHQHDGHTLAVDGSWCTQRWQITRGKRIQMAAPRTCVALFMSVCPPR